RPDQPGPLGERHELARRQQAAHGMLPAHEGLDADDAAARETDFRLVEEHELFGLERAAELASERRPAGVARAGVRLVDRDAGAPVLRGEPRDVRVADERLCILAAPADRAADAG